MHDPELTLNKMKLGMMLGTRVARGHCLEGDYGKNEGNRGTDASGQVPHSSSSVRIDVPARALLGQYGESPVTEDFLHDPVDLPIQRRRLHRYDQKLGMPVRGCHRTGSSQAGKLP
ncbi:MAG: hypothetical protein PVSMB1_12580 [Gemmatimonadaceae bacterium]